MIGLSSILVAEDDRALGAFLKRALAAEGHKVDLVEDGEAALAAFRVQLPDLVILDLSLRSRDGSSVLQCLRLVSSATPVMILTGAMDLETRLQCFNLGADDCLLKPFSLRELKARCSALLRRKGDTESVLRYGGLELDRIHRQVLRNGQTVSLTNKEFALLECLMLNEGRCVTRGALLQHVWNLGTEATSNIVDVYINYLRRKLQNEGGTQVIATVRGEGYRISQTSQDHGQSTSFA